MAADEGGSPEAANPSGAAVATQSERGTLGFLVGLDIGLLVLAVATLFDTVTVVFLIPVVLLLIALGLILTLKFRVPRSRRLVRGALMAATILAPVLIVLPLFLRT